MIDYLNEKYSITDVVDCMLKFEIKTGDSFFDNLLESVDGKNIKVCREKEINESITITNEYDLIIVQDGICITIKRDSVLNMFNNLDDYNEHTKEVELEIV